MGHKPTDTVGDLLRLRSGVLCRCINCGHRGRVSLVILARKFPRNALVERVGERMICSHCGSRRIVTQPDWSHLAR